MSVSHSEKERDKGGEKWIPFNVPQYISSTVSCALALLWKFVLLEGKEKTFQINQSICVMCAAPQHVASISVFCCVPPLFYPSQRLVTIEDVFVVENKSFQTGFHIQFIFNAILALNITTAKESDLLQQCSIGMIIIRVSRLRCVCVYALVVCWLMSQ